MNTLAYNDSNNVDTTELEYKEEGANKSVHPLNKSKQQNINNINMLFITMFVRQVMCVVTINFIDHTYSDKSSLIYWSYNIFGQDIYFTFTFLLL